MAWFISRRSWIKRKGRSLPALSSPQYQRGIDRLFCTYPKTRFGTFWRLNKYVSENGLAIKSYDSYADHYSDTLAIWRNEFNKKWDLIKKQGFDLTFKKMWEFYLSYCEAGFKSKNIDLIQFSLQNQWSLKETND